MRELRGFSLIEILVAFVILSLSVGVLMRVFSGGLNNIGMADRYTHAVVIGRSVLASLGHEVPLQSGEQIGDAGKGYRWRASINSFTDSQANVQDVSAPVQLYRVELEVTWEGKVGTEGKLRFDTFRMAVSQ